MNNLKLTPTGNIRVRPGTSVKLLPKAEFVSRTPITEEAATMMILSGVEGYCVADTLNKDEIPEYFEQIEKINTGKYTDHYVMISWRRAGRKGNLFRRQDQSATRNLCSFDELADWIKNGEYDLVEAKELA